MTLRENLERVVALMRSGEVTAYRVAQETGISQYQLSLLKNGGSSIDNLRLWTAERLDMFYVNYRIEEIIGAVINALEKDEDTYHVKHYSDIHELLDERDLTLNDLKERVNHAVFDIIEDTNILLYETSDTSLFSIAYFDSDSNVSNIIQHLKG